MYHLRIKITKRLNIQVSQKLCACIQKITETEQRGVMCWLFLSCAGMFWDDLPAAFFSLVLNYLLNYH